MERNRGKGKRKGKIVRGKDEMKNASLSDFGLSSYKSLQTCKALYIYNDDYQRVSCSSDEWVSV